MKHAAAKLDAACMCKPHSSPSYTLSRILGEPDSTPELANKEPHLPTPSSLTRTPRTFASFSATLAFVAAALASTVNCSIDFLSRDWTRLEAGETVPIRAAASCRDKNFWRMICILTTIDTADTRQLRAKKTMYGTNSL
jgi:hypothetical protein